MKFNKSKWTSLHGNYLDINQMEMDKYEQENKSTRDQIL
jgi:hypothetical protein